MHKLPLIQVSRALLIIALMILVPGVICVATELNQCEVRIAEVETYLAKGIDLDKPNGMGMTLLMKASCSGQVEIARILLDHGADVNITNTEGNTPLIFAIKNVNPYRTEYSKDMVKLLIEYGADPTIPNSAGESALTLASNASTEARTLPLIETYAEFVELMLSPKPGNTIGVSPMSIINSSATGWVTLGGYVVTNYHVIDDHIAIRVRFSSISDKEYPAKVVASDKNNDLALLKLEDSPVFNEIPGLRISSTLPNPGKKVFTIGYPKSSIMGNIPKVTDGTVSAVSGLEDDPIVMQITVPRQLGSSGGPLIDMKGNVVGVTTSTLRTQVTERGIDVPQNVHYAVMSAYVNALLYTLPIDNSYPMVTVTGDSLANIVPQVKNSIAHILVQSIQ